jgi:hypothetical protein
MGHKTLVETPAEIIAKKMYFRGHEAKGRDLFDMALVLENERDALILASQYLLRHRDEFVRQLTSREQALRTEFDAIHTLDYRPTFDDCVERVRRFLLDL